MMAKSFTRHAANPIIPVIPNTWRNYVTANVDILQVQDEWRLYFRGNGKHENGLLSRSIRQEMAVMFSVFKLKDHKEKSETALVIRESADFIGFGTKMP
ncbi:MAG: hypothetical protein AAF702_00945, partial [Chloroflexota bacterium]